MAGLFDNLRATWRSLRVGKAADSAPHPKTRSETAGPSPYKKGKPPPHGVIRTAHEDDAGQILNIYAPYVAHSPFTLELDIPAVETIRSRVRENGRIGWLVCEVDGEIIGYAYASKHRERGGYQWCCDVSVYVADRWHGHGIAPMLYRRLFSRLKQNGLIHVYAGITLPNSKSVRLHETMGFKLIGIYQKTGFKLGRWHDVGWWGLQLAEFPETPHSPQHLHPRGAIVRP